jgi:hypothetical protein
MSAMPLVVVTHLECLLAGNVDIEQVDLSVLRYEVA